MEKSQYAQLRAKFQFQPRASVLTRHVLIDFALVACLFFFSQILPAYALLFFSPVISILFFRSFSLMHEAVHNLCHSKKWVNDLAGTLSGAICMLPFEPWKKSHLEHHYWTGNYQKDPVMALLTFLPSLPSPLKNLSAFLWKIWFPVVAILQHVVFWQLCVKNTFKTHSLKSWVSNLTTLFFWAAFFLFTPKDFLVWCFLPGLTLYLISVEVVNLPHHLQMPMNSGSTRITIPNQHVAARTCVYPRFFARFVVLNFNYHTEHHMLPDAPWYYLEEIHQSLKPSLGADMKTDQSFEWIKIHRKLDLFQVIEIQASEKPQDQAS